MNKFKSAVLISVFALPLFTGFFETKNSPLILFPEITYSSSAEFGEEENNDNRVEIVEQEEEIQVKFKFFEWLKSVF